MALEDRVKTAGKIAISLGILGYLLWWIPLGDVAGAISQIRLPTIVGLSVMSIAKVLITTASIYVLMTYYTEISYSTAFKLDSMNTIANTFIPSRLGTIVSMPLLIDRYTSANKSEGAVIQTTQLVLMTTITGLTAGVGWILFQGRLSTSMSVILGVSVLLYFAFPAAVGGSYFLSGTSIVQKHVISRLSIPSVQQGVWIDVSRLAIAAGCLLGTRLLTAGGRMWILSIEFGVDLALHELVLIPALMYSVTVLPISLGGIGVAETSGATVLVALGVPVETAAAFIIVDRVFVTYLPLLGLYTYLNISGPPTYESVEETGPGDTDL